MINEFKELQMIEKLEALLGHFGNSAKLAHKLDVSRSTIVNWVDNPGSIRPARALDIDVLYCNAFVTPALDKMPAPEAGSAILLPDDYKMSASIAHLRQFAYGTYEIEDADADPEMFQRIIEDETHIPKGISREAFIGMLSSYRTAKQIYHQIIDGGKQIRIDDDFVCRLHSDLMQMIRDDAGQYAAKGRGMGKLEDIDTTDPDDIPAEVAYWCKRYEDVRTLQEIAAAHAHFIRIHPFGDSNGRVGRALMLAQCLQAGLMPPILGKHNQVIYYSTMEYAMRHGRHKPLASVLHSAQKEAQRELSDRKGSSWKPVD